MARKDTLILDHLCDSPLISPAALSGFGLLSNVAANTLAEHILNDPEAWNVLSYGDEPRPNFPPEELEMLEQFSWLEKELRPSSTLATSTGIRELRTMHPLEDGGDITAPLSPTSPRAKGSARHYQERPILGRVRQGKYKLTPKPEHITVFPAFVRDPPRGLGAPSHAFVKNTPGLEGDNLIPSASLVHLLNPKPVPFSQGVGVGFTRVLEGLMDHYIPSPLTSEASTSPTSSADHGRTLNKIRPLPSFDHLKPTDIPSSELLAPPLSGAATGTASPFSVNSASTTSSFLEWYGVPPESPLAGITVGGNDQASSSTTLSHHLPTESSSLAQTVIVGSAESHQNNDVYGPPKMASVSIIKQQKNLLGQEGTQVQDAPVPDADISTIPSPMERFQKEPGHNLSSVSGRNVVVCRSPLETKPSSPVLTRGSPKLQPTIPVPGIPSDDPPPVPPKDIFREPRGVMFSRVSKANAKGKAPLRRLPSIPKRTKRAPQNTEFESPSSSRSPMNDTPPPEPPRAHTHAPYRSLKISEPLIQTPQNGARVTRARSNPSTRPSLDTSLAATRTTPCPAGPRKRGPSNSTSPIKSPPGRWTPGHASSNSVPVIPAAGVYTSSPISIESPVAMSRSILPRHGCF